MERGFHRLTQEAHVLCLPWQCKDRLGTASTPKELTRKGAKLASQHTVLYNRMTSKGAKGARPWRQQRGNGIVMQL